jgi:hypothetical protein
MGPPISKQLLQQTFQGPAKPDFAGQNEDKDHSQHGAGHGDGDGHAVSFMVKRKERIRDDPQGQGWGCVAPGHPLRSRANRETTPESSVELWTVSPATSPLKSLIVP